MRIPLDMELLSQHVETLLGSEYQALPIAIDALKTEAGHPSFEKDEHRTHLAILFSLIGADTPALILEIITGESRRVYPVIISAYGFAEYSRCAAG